MRPTNVLTAIGLLWLVAVSGCLGGEAPADHGTDTIVITDPTDTSRLNESGLHLHDYWNGENRRLLMEEERQSGGLISSCEGWSWEVFRPAPNHTVLQGAAMVEVTLSWKPGAGDVFSEPELWIKTAADDRALPFRSIGSGETAQFSALVNQSDLPHSVLSNWQFHFYLHPGNPNDPMCQIKFSGEVSIRVEILRGLEIPLFPGHPDLWKNSTSLGILADRRNVRFYQGPEPPQGGLCLSDADGNCLWKPHVPQNGTIVPYDATHLEVVVSNQASIELGFAHHGADTWDLTFAQETIAAESSHTFSVPVGPTQGDGPYAIQSLWEFWIWPSHNSKTYAGEYAITITALQ